MKKQLRKILNNYRRLDGAVLYLRLFMGGVLLLHNVGKLQTYNEIIESYPAMLTLSGRASFVIVSLIEVIAAVLLMIGLRVRTVAAVLVLGFGFAVWRDGFGATDEIRFLWVGISLALWIAGGGAYALDAVPAEPPHHEREGRKCDL